MPKYALLMYMPPEPLSREEIAAEHPRWAAFAQSLSEAGAMVFNQGLAGADAATTVRVREGETLVSDGPFAETKEILGGLFLIDVADLDEALKWAAQIPVVERGSVEVRPVWG